MRRAFFLAAVLTLATADWKLVFEDNFDGTSPSINTSKWDFEIGYIRNNELQWYDNSSTNVNITDGSLLITATNQTQSLPNGVVPYCRSGSIYSIESFIYGRFEMRAKLPGRQGNGTWPAFWLLGADVDTTGWPMCGEIDIMENVGFDRNTLFTTLHDAQNSSERNNDISNHVQVPTMYTEFNVYSVEWRPNFIEFFVNNQSVLRYDNDNRCRSTSWPWFKPFQIKVNLAIGGAWGGSHGVDESIFPAQYAVDYIRVYQETEDKVPNCDLAFAYILFETSVETSMLRWMVMATGNHLVQLHNAVEEDISRLAGVNSSSVHTWAVIVRDKDGRGQLCLNVSLLNWSENIRDWFFAQALSSAAWATTLQSALSNALPSDPTLSPLYAGSEYPFGTDRVAFKPRRLHVAEVLHIPAWEYDFGGPSVAFHDTTPWNQCGNFGRAPPDTVDVGAGEGGNFAVGYIRPTEFLHFSEISIVNSSSLGAHALLRIKARYASVSDADSSCQVEIVTATGGLLVTSLNFSNTGSWEAFTDSLWSDVRVPADVLSSFGIALRFHDPSPFNIQSLHLLVASI